MSTNDTFVEPESPSVPAFSPARRDIPAPDLVGPARPTQDQGFKQREQDLIDYKADLEHRIQRSEQLAAKRREQNTKQEVDVVSELDRALEALDAGATDFDQSYGKPNQPLIDATMEVDRLRSELVTAESWLARIQARGDSVTRLPQSVIHAEPALNGLLSTAEGQAMRKLIAEQFGWDAPGHKIRRETLRELALDISVQSLREFVIQPQRGMTNDVTALQQRLDVVGRQLVALRERLDTDLTLANNHHNF